MANVIWQGTADNTAINMEHPMRITEDGDGRLMTEWASDTENADGNIVFDTDAWYADSGKTFRDMQPKPSVELEVRMVKNGLLDGLKVTAADQSEIRLTNGTETFLLFRVTSDETGPVHGLDSRGCGYTKCNTMTCEHEHAPAGETVWHDDENTEELWVAAQ